VSETMDAGNGPAVWPFGGIISRAAQVGASG
jgi:hypothetical protein